MDSNQSNRPNPSVESEISHGQGHYIDAPERLRGAFKAWMGTANHGWMCYCNHMAIIASFIHPKPDTVDQVHKRLAAMWRGTLSR